MQRDTSTRSPGKVFHPRLEALWSQRESFRRPCRTEFERSRTTPASSGDEIAKDLACARKFAGILYGFSNLSGRIIKAHGNRLAQLHMEVVCGRMTYKDLYRKLLHFNRVLKTPLVFSK